MAGRSQLRHEFINQKMKLKKNLPNRKRKELETGKESYGDVDFRGRNANIWIQSYQKETEIKREKRKHFTK